MNKDYESLNGLVAENMIESLKTKIETLSPNQRQLIAMNESDMIIYTISDIDVTTDATGMITEINIICIKEMYRAYFFS
jgi:5'-3' exonuclease